MAYAAILFVLIFRHILFIKSFLALYYQENEMRDDSLFKYIKQFFTSDTFGRGQGYFAGGHVKDVVIEDKTITALVKGS